jgi:hypothetical protein
MIRYRYIRIEAVHYCELQEILEENRKRRSFRARTHEPADVPAIRLRLLANTLKDNRAIAQAVNFIKIPYMTRETCKPDLARAISACPNLLYVDLPDGCFHGDASCNLLMQELQEDCRHIRKMRYERGGEASFELLTLRKWAELEVLQVSGLQIEPLLLRKVLGSLAYLRELELSKIGWLSDEIFQPDRAVPAFPVLKKLTLKKTPGITAAGLCNYLSEPLVAHHLSSLTLDETGVPVDHLYEIVNAGRHLEWLSIVATVSAGLSGSLPPLASNSLRSLSYEITSASSAHTSLHPPAESYYGYLIQCLQANSLPTLRTLYVRDENFPETLALAPPVPSFAAGSKNPFQRGFDQQLEVYTKGNDDTQEWAFTSLGSPTMSDDSGRRGSFTGNRPLSSYSAHKGLGPSWGQGDARKSIVLPNGVGGFLAVPADIGTPERPRTSSGADPGFEKNRGSWYNRGHERRGSRADLWR